LAGTGRDFDATGRGRVGANPVDTQGDVEEEPFARLVDQLAADATRDQAEHYRRDDRHGLPSRFWYRWCPLLLRKSRQRCGQTIRPSTATDATICGSSVILRPRWGGGQERLGLEVANPEEDELPAFDYLEAHSAEAHMGGAAAIIGEDDLVGRQGNLGSVSEDDGRSRDRSAGSAASTRPLARG